MVARSAACSRRTALLLLMSLLGGGASGPLPFPSVPRMGPVQRAAYAEVRREAVAASAAATPRLLELLDSPGFRAHLATCCSRSGVASWPAERLLEDVREHVYASELVHNFDGSGHSGVTLEIAMHNATEYFPTSWEMLRLGYLGDPNDATYGHPASPADAAEEGVFRFPPFRGVHDLPATYEEAASRLQYVALNALRVDAGNPAFGHVAAVFSGSFWQDAVAASPIDTGVYSFCCNETYMKTPGSLKVPCSAFGALVCSEGRIAPGVFGAIDHAILNNQLFWGSWNRLGKWFEMSHGDVIGNVTLSESMTFLESNILGNVLYEERGIKLLVGAFVPLFGTPRGTLLREYAASHGIALAWALGPGVLNATDDDKTGYLTWRPDIRLLDSETARRGLVNVSMQGASLAGFDDIWAQAGAARARSAESLLPRLVALWAAAKQASPAGLHLQLPAAWDCSDRHACLGRSGLGDCVCYPSREDAAIVV